MKKLIAFPRMDEFDKARAKLDLAGVSYIIIAPAKAYENVGIPALAVEQEGVSILFSSGADLIYSGLADYKESKVIQDDTQADFTEDIFGKPAIMVLSPCIADETKIRLIAHLSKDISQVMPYLNAQISTAFYNNDAKILTFMEQYRMVTLYSGKIAIAKADEIVDAWRLLEKIRRLVNTTWQNRHSITPSEEMRKKPPALEIYFRLPRTNCGQCGLSSCMAFALTLWGGNIEPSFCKPIFEGEHTYLKDAFSEICMGLGVAKQEK
jgi:ArsR family metal-binding transcriptional regulator